MALEDDMKTRLGPALEHRPTPLVDERHTHSAALFVLYDDPDLTALFAALIDVSV